MFDRATLDKILLDEFGLYVFNSHMRTYTKSKPEINIDGLGRVQSYSFLEDSDIFSYVYEITHYENLCKFINQYLEEKTKKIEKEILDKQAELQKYKGLTTLFHSSVMENKNNSCPIYPGVSVSIISLLENYLFDVLRCNSNDIYSFIGSKSTGPHNDIFNIKQTNDGHFEFYILDKNKDDFFKKIAEIKGIKVTIENQAFKSLPVRVRYPKPRISKMEVKIIVEDANIFTESLMKANNAVNVDKEALVKSLPCQL